MDESSRSQRIAKVLLDSKLIVANRHYRLDDIYNVVKSCAEITESEQEWKHTVRRLIQEVNGKRCLNGIRMVNYYGDEEYSFE
jgi:hypothetical protein